MENIVNAEQQEQLIESIDEIMKKLRVDIPSSLTKPQVIAILQLFVELYA